MSPGERAATGRREPARPQYGAAAPGFPPPYYGYGAGVPHPNAWLGAPLIAMAGRPGQPARNTPVAKLAMQAQGAPLIIQNRHDRRKFAPPEQRNHRPLQDHRCEAPDVKSRAQQPPARSARGARNHNTDAVSVASDESSGSNNSETMLPRIIKPRKRRKKDRKPNNVMPHDMSSANLDLGDVDNCSVSGFMTASHNIYEESYCREMSLPYRLDVKVMDYPEPAPERYRVSALGEALEATRFGLAEAVSPVESAVSSCQCRYCDPVGQIWDAESIANLLDENSSGDFAPTKLEDSMKVVGPLGRRGPDTTLRRSWSDPSSRVPERKNVNNTETYSAPNLYSLFPPTRRTSSPEPLSLEISSEIVTSMNGHRDLEIKFFSTSPSANSGRRSFFADKSESGINKCTDSKVNSGVLSDKAETGVENKNSEEVTETGCTPAYAAGARRNVCDLALVTA